jgi:hypothetical protein
MVPTICFVSVVIHKTFNNQLQYITPTGSRCVGDSPELGDPKSYDFDQVPGVTFHVHQLLIKNVSLQVHGPEGAPECSPAKPDNAHAWSR